MLKPSWIVTWRLPRRVLYSLTGDVPLDRLWHPITQNATCLFDTTTDPSTLPMWLNEQDLLYYSGENRRTGFRGSLNWYRNFDGNWEYMALFAGAKIIQPALFIGGERDQVPEIPGLQMALERIPEYVTDLRGSMVLDGCGHWVQQERPEAVNAALIRVVACPEMWHHSVFDRAINTTGLSPAGSQNCRLLHLGDTLRMWLGSG